MNIKRISVYALFLTVAAAVMRSAQFLFLFDPDTGFFVDNGILSAVALVLIFLLPVGIKICASAKKTLYGRVKFSRSIIMGIGSLVCAAIMAFGIKLLQSERVLDGRGLPDTAMGISFRGPFVWTFLCMVLFFVVSAIAWLSGKALFQHAKALYLIAVAWALSLILYAFIHYSISVLTTENLFVILLSCSAAMAFMAQARFFADLNPQGKSLRLLVPATAFSEVMMTSYGISGLFIRFANIHPKDEVSLYLELIILAVGIYMFLVLFSLRFVPLAVPTKGKATEGRRYKVDIKREL